MALAKIKIYNSETLKPQHVQYFQHYDHNVRISSAWFATRKLRKEQFDCFVPISGINDDPRFKLIRSIEKNGKRFYSIKDVLKTFPEIADKMQPHFEYFYDLTKLFRIHNIHWRKRMMQRYDRKLNGEPIRSAKIH
jgi:hypothetical protein